jgi:hypothetical protein
MAQFSSWKSLTDEIMKRSKEALEKEVAPVVKSKLLKHIREDVYDKYQPVKYERRTEEGQRLSNPNNVISEMDGNTLYVKTIAVGSRPIVKKSRWDYSDPTNFAKLISAGAKNIFNRNEAYPWAKPQTRPFVANTQKEINENPKVILDIIKNKIEKG